VNWKNIAHQWLERIIVQKPKQGLSEDFWEDPEQPAPEEYDPHHCRECGDTTMSHPRRTCCCNEVICFHCARDLFDEQMLVERIFMCPFCGTSYSILQTRIRDEVLEEFRQHNYFSLLRRGGMV